MERTLDTDALADEIACKLAHLSSPTVPTMRSVRREYSRLLAPAPPGHVIDIALGLAGRSVLGCRFVGYELISHHKAAFTSLTPKQLIALGWGMDSWDAVDCFACYLSGPAWRDGQLPSTMVRTWTQHKDRWWRRAALVSTIALSRRGTSGDVRRAIEVCSLLASDTDDMVAKALSWALRELAKKDPHEARRFLDRHHDTLRARVTREVQNKITTGLKNPRRRT